MPSFAAVSAITSSLKLKQNPAAILKPGSSSSSLTSVSSNLSGVFTTVKGKASAVAAKAGSAMRQAKGKLDAVFQSDGAPTSATDLEPAAVVADVQQQDSSKPEEFALQKLEAMGFSREAAECALLQVDATDVDGAAELLCEQENLMTAVPDIPATDPELSWALRASLEQAATEKDSAPSTPWFRRPSVGTWLVTLPVAIDNDNVVTEPWFQRPSVGTWLVNLPVANDDDNAVNEDAGLECIMTTQQECDEDAEEKAEEKEEENIILTAQPDAISVTDKLTESLELSPTRAGSIRGGA